MKTKLKAESGKQKGDGVYTNSTNLHEEANADGANKSNTQHSTLNAQHLTSCEPYITKEEVAGRLRKPVRTIEDWMRRRIIPFYKLGQAVRFRWSKVQAHFEARYCIGAEKILTTDERELTRMGNLKAERKAEPPYVGCYSKGRQ